jgi:type II secretory pathway component PulF
MAFFRYKILTAKGKQEKGLVELPFKDVSPAIRYLERQGGVVLSIDKLSPLVATITRISTYGFSGISRMTLAEFLNNMAILLRSGVSVLDALNDILEDTTNQMLKMTLKFIRSDIESGQTFSEAIARHPRVFSPLIVNLARIGEETGNMDAMLLKASNHLRHVQDIISGTKRALMYPAFMTILVFSAAIFWFYFVIPRLAVLFEDFGIEMPGLTKALLAIGNSVQSYLGITLLILLCFVVLIIVLRRTFFRVRYALDYIMLKTPILSRILELSIVAQICENLGLMLGAGINVLTAFAMIRDSVANTVYKYRLTLAENNVKAGNPISLSFRQAKALHPFAVRMIMVGEASGRIDEQTEYVASVYRERLDGMVQILGKTLEPALLIIMGVIFGTIVGGFLLPIYDLVSNLNV